MDDSADRRWRYHLARDQLLAEVHARPSTALAAPMLATRIATLSGEDGAAIDCQHMVALCRRLGQSQPSASSKWCVLDAGSWKLRWHDTLNFRPGRFFGRQREVIRSLKPAWTWFRLSGCDVTPNLHPVPIRASASLLPTWAGEARGCVAVPTSRRGIALGNQESMQATSPLTGVGTGPFFALHPFKALSQVSGGRAGLPQLGSGSGRGTLRQKSQA